MASSAIICRCLVLCSHSMRIFALQNCCLLCILILTQTTLLLISIYRERIFIIYICVCVFSDIFHSSTNYCHYHIVCLHTHVETFFVIVLYRDHSVYIHFVCPLSSTEVVMLTTHGKKKRDADWSYGFVGLLFGQILGTFRNHCATSGLSLVILLVTAHNLHPPFPLREHLSRLVVTI
jgi:hypothetical protein